MVFFSAFLLGLLGSMHCVGMCGGLQTVLNKPQAIRTPAENQRHLIAMNLGRVTLYSLAGAGFGFVGATLGTQLNVPGWSVILRQLMALLMIIIGLQLAFRFEKPLAFLEQAGYSLWRRIKPLFNRPDSMTYSQSFRRGLLWGFLPCGLVYSMLAVATVSGSAKNGLFTMLGFGLGTLPAMLLTGYFLWKFKQILQWQWVRHGSGVFLILIGLFMLAPTLLSHGHHHTAQHETHAHTHPQAKHHSDNEHASQHSMHIQE